MPDDRDDFADPFAAFDPAPPGADAAAGAVFSELHAHPDDWEAPPPLPSRASKVFQKPPRSAGGEATEQRQRQPQPRGDAAPPLRPKKKRNEAPPRTSDSAHSSSSSSSSSDVAAVEVSGAEAEASGAADEERIDFSDDEHELVQQEVHLEGPPSRPAKNAAGPNVAPVAPSRPAKANLTGEKKSDDSGGGRVLETEPLGLDRDISLSPSPPERPPPLPRKELFARHKSVVSHRRKSLSSHAGAPPLVGSVLTWARLHAESRGCAAFKREQQTHKAFRDGWALLAICDSVCDTSLFSADEEMDELSSSREKCEQRCSLAFRTLEGQIGVPQLLDAEDLVEVQDRHSIIAYLQLVHEKSGGKIAIVRRPAEPASGSESLSIAQPASGSESLSIAQPAPSKRVRKNTDPPPPPPPRAAKASSGKTMFSRPETAAQSGTSQENVMVAPARPKKSPEPAPTETNDSTAPARPEKSPEPASVEMSELTAPARPVKGRVSSEPDLKTTAERPPPLPKTVGTAKRVDDEKRAAPARPKTLSNPRTIPKPASQGDLHDAPVLSPKPQRPLPNQGIDEEKRTTGASADGGPSRSPKPQRPLPTLEIDQEEGVSAIGAADMARARSPKPQRPTPIRNNEDAALEAATVMSPTGPRRPVKESDIPPRPETVPKREAAPSIQPSDVASLRPLAADRIVASDDATGGSTAPSQSTPGELIRDMPPAEKATNAGAPPRPQVLAKPKRAAPVPPQAAELPAETVTEELAPALPVRLAKPSTPPKVVSKADGNAETTDSDVLLWLRDVARLPATLAAEASETLCAEGYDSIESLKELSDVDLVDLKIKMRARKLIVAALAGSTAPPRAPKGQSRPLEQQLPPPKPEKPVIPRTVDPFAEFDFDGGSELAVEGAVNDQVLAEEAAAAKAKVAAEAQAAAEARAADEARAEAKRKLAMEQKAVAQAKVAAEKKAAAERRAAEEAERKAALDAKIAAEEAERRTAEEEERTLAMQAAPEPVNPWEEVKTDDGEVYWWNTETDATSWEKPDWKPPKVLPAPPIKKLPALPGDGGPVGARSKVFGTAGARGEAEGMFMTKKSARRGWGEKRKQRPKRDFTAGEEPDYGDFSGYMEFLGTGVFSSWTARWIVVHDSPTLQAVRVYRFQDDIEPAHEWPLSELFCEEFAHPHRKRGSTIHICWKPNKRKKHYYAACRTYEEMDAWLEVLRGKSLRPESAAAPSALLERPVEPEADARALAADRANRWVTPSPGSGTAGSTNNSLMKASSDVADAELGEYRRNYDAQRAKQREEARERALLLAFTNFGNATLEAEVTGSALVDHTGSVVDPSKARSVRGLHVNYEIRVRFVLGEKGVREGDLERVLDQSWQVTRTYAQIWELFSKLGNVSGYKTRPLEKPSVKNFHSDALLQRLKAVRQFLADLVEQRKIIFDSKAKSAMGQFLSPVQMGDFKPDGFLAPLPLDDR